ncbi:MAG: hypothetical protein HZC17_01005 [Candidatus Omnitrophica bacterium]|nr:hypothetical protein [Candidatus Omnitrophota bacterium]
MMTLFKKIFSVFAVVSIVSLGFPLTTLRAEAAKAVTPFYLEIYEDNVDSFPVEGNTEGMETLDPPFWIENGKVFFDQGLGQAIASGEAKQNYNLLIAPAQFNEGSVKLLVKHLIHYEGKGRNMDITHYYLFDSWPAVITFAPMNVDREKINIDLEENEGKLLNIRLTEETLAVDFDNLTGKLRCKYGQLVTEIPKDRAWQISEKSQKISVSREMTTKHQIKDPKGAGVPETTRHEFGEVEFKTKLTLKNLGNIVLA